MTYEEIITLLNEELHPEVVKVMDEAASPPAIVVKSDDIVAVANCCYSHEKLYFDQLACITGLDNGPEAGTMEVIYNFYSIPYHHALMVKVLLPRDEPRIASITSLYKTADWQEREIYDMYGIYFTDHPDLRRILMPADWEGYPLRKDYQQQEMYRGIKVAYDDGE